MTHTYPASRSHITEKEFRVWRATALKDDPALATYYTPGELRMMARLDLREPTPEWDLAELKEHMAIAKHIGDRTNFWIQGIKACLQKGTH